MKKLLLLDDDTRLRQSLALEFKERGYAVTEAAAVSEIPATAFDYAVVDMRLVGELGLKAISRIRESSPAARIVVLTGYGSIANTVEAMKLGAADYLRKPVSLDQLEKALIGAEGAVPSRDIEPRRPLRLSEVEHEYIDFILTENKGNISKTARDLGLHRQSLQRKLKKQP